MKTGWYRVLFLLFLPFGVQASLRDTLRVRGDEAGVDLIPHAWFFSTQEDLTPEDAWNRLNDSPKKLQTSTVGFSKEIYWIAVNLRSDAHSIVRSLVEIENPQLDWVTAFEITKTRIDTVLHTGDALPFLQRHLTSRNFIIPVQVDPNEVYTLLIRVDKRNSSVSFPMYLWGYEQLYQKDYRSNLGFGIYFGLVFLCAVYALLTFIFLKRAIYFYYFLWIVSSGLFSSTHLGFSYQYLYPHWQVFNNIFRVLMEIATTMAFLTFTRYFLKTASLVPSIDRIFKFISYLFGSLVVIGFSLYPFVDSLGLYLMPLLTVVISSILVLILLVLYQTYGRQREEVLFYLAAFGAVIVGSLVLLASEIGWLNDRAFIVNPYLIGSGLELVIFSLAITWQIKKIFDERNLLSLQFANHQQELLKAHIEGIEQERSRIGRELHDNIASRLSTLARMPKAGDTAMQLLTQETQSLYQEVRSLSHALAAPAAKNIGLVQLLSELVFRINQVSKVQITVQHYDLPETLGDEMTTHLYRVVQEAVENTVKHSNATSVDIQLFGRDGELIITYEDNGTGLDFSAWQEGVGMRNIRARIQHLNGLLEINASHTGMQMLITVRYEKP